MILSQACSPSKVEVGTICYGELLCVPISMKQGRVPPANVLPPGWTHNSHFPSTRLGPLHCPQSDLSASPRAGLEINKTATGNLYHTFLVNHWERERGKGRRRKTQKNNENETEDSYILHSPYQRPFCRPKLRALAPSRWNPRQPGLGEWPQRRTPTQRLSLVYLYLSHHQVKAPSNSEQAWSWTCAATARFQQTQTEKQQNKVGKQWFAWANSLNMTANLRPNLGKFKAMLARYSVALAFYGAEFQSSKRIR